MTKKIFVNEIINEKNGSQTGFIVWNDTIIENMNILYDNEIQSSLKYLIQHPPNPEGFYVFTRFYQLIVLFQYDINLGISIKLSDYKNNIDNALDEYLKLAQHEWNLEDRNTIMKIFEEIRNDNSNDKAEMIIKFHVSA